MCLGFLACDDAGEGPDAHGTTQDAAPPNQDAGPRDPRDAFVEADTAVVDAGVQPDAAPRMPCTRDDACGEVGFCDDDGACSPAAEPFVASFGDGVTRAGAAAFDITPGYLEAWTDRAGEACPQNRAGRFDGRLDDPSPADPCADGFEDANGDGVFDAVWVGGDGLDRPALQVDNDNPPEGRVLVLTRDETLYLVVTLDVHAVDAARVRTFARRLQLRLGVPAGSVAVHATGSRSGPDAVGLSGPSLARSAAFDALLNRLGSHGGLLEGLPAQSGTDEAWWDELARRCASAARQAGTRLVPAEVRAARAALPVDPDPPFEGEVVLDDDDGDEVVNDRQDLKAWRTRAASLSRDLHLPARRDREVRGLVLQSTIDHAPLVHLLSWGAAPAATPLDTPTLSADFPGAARRYVEARRPGTVAVWLSGAAADTVLAGRGVHVPEVDDEGRMVGEDGDPVERVEVAAAAANPAEALGRLVAGLESGRVIPVAIEYPFGQERLPEVVILIGETIDLSCVPRHSASGWSELLASRLEAAQDRLAVHTVARNDAPFDTMLSGRRGVGVVYDGWRYLQARFRGETFRPGHGQPEA